MIEFLSVIIKTFSNGETQSQIYVEQYYLFFVEVSA